MTQYVTTDDPRTVAACPECNSNDVYYRGRAATDEKPYRCEGCSTMIADWVERANGNRSPKHPYGGDDAIDERFRCIPLPATVWVSSRSNDVYHREDCPRLSENRSPRRLAIAESWDTYEPCGYCIDDLPPNSGNTGGGPPREVADD